MRFKTIEKRLKKEFMDRGWVSTHDFIAYGMFLDFIKKNAKDLKKTKIE
jgi:hypothetical protein|tara:strand:+ start:172 stop:318 length:147 start_codon:yes stop_codon:yes gene_type:complete